MNVRLSACTLGSYHATPVCSSLCPSSLPFCCPIVVLSGAMHVNKFPDPIIFSSALWLLFCSGGLSWLPTACSAQRAGSTGSSLHVSQLRSPRVPARFPRTVVRCSVSAPLTAAPSLQLASGTGWSSPSPRHCLGLAGATGWDHWLALHCLAGSRAIYSCPSLPSV